MYFSDEIIKVCKNCHGIKPCQCDKHEYINMVRWIYDLMKQLNPMG